MNQKPAPPGGTEPATSGLTTRKDRLASALRENLKRRKAQGRARAVSAAATAGADKSSDKA